MKKTTIPIIFVILIFMGAIAFAAPTQQQSKGETYIVQADDWLSKIALKYFDDMFAYTRIVEATNAKAAEDNSFIVINNPDLIEVGQKLWIPTDKEETSDTNTESETSTPDENILILDILRNIAYNGIYDEPVQLINGKYEGKPFVEGGTSKPTVTLLDSFHIFGDLNGDGHQDAVVILVEDSGGSGSFMYIASVIGQASSNPINMTTLLIGDRFKINSIYLEVNKVIISGATHGPEDPMCCPSLEVTRHYQVQAGELMEIQ